MDELRELLRAVLRQGGPDALLDRLLEHVQHLEAELLEWVLLRHDFMQYDPVREHVALHA